MSSEYGFLARPLVDISWSSCRFFVHPDNWWHAADFLREFITWETAFSPQNYAENCFPFACSELRTYSISRGSHPLDRQLALLH
jgi:hypothetical protein